MASISLSLHDFCINRTSSLSAGVFQLKWPGLSNFVLHSSSVEKSNYLKSIRDMRCHDFSKNLARCRNSISQIITKRLGRTRDTSGPQWIAASDFIRTTIFDWWIASTISKQHFCDTKYTWPSRSVIYSYVVRMSALFSIQSNRNAKLTWCQQSPRQTD